MNVENSSSNHTQLNIVHDASSATFEGGDRTITANKQNNTITGHFKIDDKAYKVEFFTTLQSDNIDGHIAHINNQMTNYKEKIESAKQNAPLSEHEFDDFVKNHDKTLKTIKDKNEINNPAAELLAGDAVSKRQPSQATAKQITSAVKNFFNHLKLKFSEQFRATQPFLNDPRIKSGDADKIATALNKLNTEKSPLSAEDRTAEIKRIANIASEALNNKKSTSGVELEASSLTKSGHKIIVLKESDGKINVYIQKKLIGIGKFGEVYKAKSVVSGENFAIKHMTTSVYVEKEESESELHNESESLAIVNENGPQEGVQEAINTQQISRADGTKRITIGKIYPDGDLQSQVETRRMSSMIGISLGGLKNNSLAELKQIAGEAFTKKIAEISQLKTPQARMLAYNNLISELSLSMQTMISKADSQNFKKEFHAFTQQIQDPNFSHASFHAPENAANATALSNLFVDNYLRVAGKIKEKETSFCDIQEVRSFAKNIVKGLINTHNAGIVHGDLKPQNFLRDGAKAVIADFGGARRKGGPKSSRKERNPTTTPGYAAGSYLDAMEHYGIQKNEENWFRAGQALDMRATGISLYEMFTGNSPPAERGAEALAFNDPQTYESMKQQMIAAGIPEEAADIIKKMMIPNPAAFAAASAPSEFPLPVTEQELARLYALL